MENIDYIVVGDGYAALFFAHQLLQNGKKFRLFSEQKRSASRISAGIINPIVLKKFTTFWRAQEQIDFLLTTLLEIEKYTGKNYLINQPIRRIFHDEKEKDLWLKKSESQELAPFLRKEFLALDGVKNPYTTGEVMQSARLDVDGFFCDMNRFFIQNDFLISEKFNYSDLKENSYQNLQFKNIVFCEGMGVLQNPYFGNLPVQPNKGHHLKVKLTEDLKNKFTIKKKHFLFPLQGELYYYGGTYDREQLHSEIDEDAKQQLLDGLAEIYEKPFDIEEINFGFRPTVKDRRPILGRHKDFHNYYVFNGLGARGILNGCYFSSELFQHIEHGKPLPSEVDLERFK